MLLARQAVCEPAEKDCHPAGLWFYRFQKPKVLSQHRTGRHHHEADNVRFTTLTMTPLYTSRLLSTRCRPFNQRREFDFHVVDTGLSVVTQLTQGTIVGNLGLLMSRPTSHFPR